MNAITIVPGTVRRLETMLCYRNSSKKSSICFSHVDQTGLLDLAGLFEIFHDLFTWSWAVGTKQINDHVFIHSNSYEFLHVHRMTFPIICWTWCAMSQWAAGWPSWPSHWLAVQWPSLWPQQRKIRAPMAWTGAPDMIHRHSGASWALIGSEWLRHVRMCEKKVQLDSIW
jgi:hypothetical protein